MERGPHTPSRACGCATRTGLVVRASHTAAALPPRTASKRTDSCSTLAAQWGEVGTVALWRLAVHGVYGAAAGSLQTALGVLPIDISDITLRAGKARDDGDGFGTGVGVDEPPVTGEVGGSGGLHGAPGDGTGRPGSAAGGGGPAGGSGEDEGGGSGAVLLVRLALMVHQGGYCSSQLG